MNKILVYGYGNPAREDDAFGPVMVDELEQWAKENLIENIEFDSNYQLNIEDSDAIADKDIVVFIDASIEPIEDFVLTEVTPSDSRIEFTMHAVSPAFILDMANKIYNKYPKTYLLHVKGYSMELQEGFTEKGKENYDKAISYIKKVLLDYENIKNYVSD